MDREEFKFQMFLRMMHLRSEAGLIKTKIKSDAEERAMYDDFAGVAWDPYLNPLADAAGF